MEVAFHSVMQLFRSRKTVALSYLAIAAAQFQRRAPQRYGRNPAARPSTTSQSANLRETGPARHNATREPFLCAEQACYENLDFQTAPHRTAPPGAYPPARPLSVLPLSLSKFLARAQSSDLQTTPRPIMAKFFFYAAAALCAVFGAAQAQTTTPAPTAVRPACQSLNFSSKAADIKSLNAVIDLAITSGLLAKNLPDPIVVNETKVSVVPFKVLNLNFELTPTIKQLKLGGLANLVPHHLNVSSPNSVIISADFNGSVTLQATFSISIQQLDLKWYSICWTDAIHKPFTCPPAVIDVTVDLEMNKPGLALDAQLNLVACGAGVPKTVCKDVTVSDILIAALQSKFEPLLARLLKRFTSASVNNLTIYWESISKLNIDIAKSGSLINAILDQLVNFSVDIVNKKGDIYNTVIDVVQKLFTSILNNLFATSLAPQFGNTCYDA